MKKFNLGLSTLICLSVLFTLDSCTTDSLDVSGDSTAKADAKNEIQYYTYGIGDRVLAPENVSANTATTEAEDIVDPDWKILVGHIIGGTGSTSSTGSTD